MAKFVVLLLLAVVSSGAMAKWSKIAMLGDNDFVAYINTKTIKRKGPILRVWVIISRIEKGTRGEMSVRALNEFDCDAHRGRTLASFAYSDVMTFGKIVASNSAIGEWTSIAPDTTGDVILERVCIYR